MKREPRSASGSKPDGPAAHRLAKPPGAASRAPSREPARDRSELRARVAVAIVGVPLALAAAWTGGWPLAILLAAVAGIASLEFHALVPARMQRAAGAVAVRSANVPDSAPPLRWLGVPAAVLLVLLAAASAGFSQWAAQAYVVLVALALASFAATVFNPRAENALLSAAATVSGALYTGGCLSFAVFVRRVPELGPAGAGMGAGTAPGPASAAPDPAAGFLLLMVPLLITWATDTAAYFGGRRFGRTRLAPLVSPGKTVEGGVAGLAAAVATGAALGWFASANGLTALTPASGALIGLALGAVGQVGDLAESRLKREAGVKDSGSVLPGHGGMLDRFDALFFNFPVAYGLVVITGIAS